jgi:ABC-type molybdenum transport system ATPase subunit/photorepair protein PhrA
MSGQKISRSPNKRQHEVEFIVPSKKSKKEEDIAGFSPRFKTPIAACHKDGSICKIVLNNFMNHQNFKWEPGPRVNVITGPNGAGKSSILQAIVIGLGENIVKA